MHLDPQIKELEYDFKDLLFQTDTGEIAPKVCLRFRVLDKKMGVI